MGETVTPESQKSPLDKATEVSLSKNLQVNRTDSTQSATSAGDKVASAVQPGETIWSASPVFTQLTFHR